MHGVTLTEASAVVSNSKEFPQLSPTAALHTFFIFQNKGCLFSGKNQRLIKNKSAFFGQKSVLWGYFFNFDNERIRPPKYPSAPPHPPGITWHRYPQNRTGKYANNNMIHWKLIHKLPMYHIIMVL